jgi:hypothetical protein
MEKAAATAKPNITLKVEIIEEVFLGEFKIEDYLQKKVALLLEKYK